MNTLDIKYRSNAPIILGLAGKAAVGKTSVAEEVVPKAQINVSNSDMIWDHIFFALPLYEMASAKKDIVGLREKERQLYSIHNIVYEIYGSSALGNIPDYNEFVELVNNIYNLPLDSYESKPRSFLQKVGDMCREYDSDCFAKWATKKATYLHKNYLKSFEFEDEASPFCVIISDVRFLNEAKAIKDMPNGILVCYEASESVRNERLFNRDGRYMTKEQINHQSEQQIDLISEISDLVINTDNLSIKDQAKQTIDLVKSLVTVNA
jgi:dephospho-CoA kinase